ncbi:MAG: hypothetical protein HY556_09970 [Euryarchaeota archaeon]|nr:hypothetical protein [Euryarchaeota archaeon]
MGLTRIAGPCIGLLVVLGGCVSPAGNVGNAAKDIGFALTHVEESERTIATLSGVTGEATWADVNILWNGKVYKFGAVASYTERWFQVEGRKDASAPIENGDKVAILAAGLGTVQFMEANSNRVIASYETMIPDNKKPLAPVPVEPANGASGVSLTPAWQWTQVADPSGVSYTLEWSLDPLFTIPLTTSKSRLTAPTSDTEPSEKLRDGQTYYWRVAATDGAGNQGAWSEAWSFATAQA